MIRTETQLDIEVLPQAVKPYLRNAIIYDSSCSETAHTFYIDGTEKAYLKISAGGKLYKDSIMTGFFHRQGLAPAVLEYVTEGDTDYLLTRALDGEDGISGNHMNDPLRLASALGYYLKYIHGLSTLDCPVKNRTAEMLQEAAVNIARGKYDREIITESIGEASAGFQRLKHLAMADTVIHGDYCLPNIIMHSYQLSGFVDVGNGGVGDSHYDLFWGIWTLKYNYKTDKYKDTFLAAYGRDKVDEDRLELCRLIAGFTE